jgi:hypothetical protein
MYIIYFSGEVKDIGYFYFGKIFDVLFFTGKTFFFNISDLFYVGEKIKTVHVSLLVCVCL